MSARKRTKARKRSTVRPIRPTLIQVVPGDLEHGIRDLTAVFDELLDAEMCGSGFERDAAIFGALRRLYIVRGMLSAYAQKAVAS